MTDEYELPLRGRGLGRFARAAITLVGYGTLFLWLLALPENVRMPLALIPVCWSLCVLLVVAALRFKSKWGLDPFYELLVLGILPLWGAILDEGLPTCRVDACDDLGIQRPFAVPELYWMLGLHAMAAVAYCISRRRREALPDAVESLLFGALTLGAVVDAVGAVQLLLLMPYALALPLTLPLLAPSLSCLLLLQELRARGRRRAYDRPAKLPARWLPFPLLGMYAAVEGLVLGRPEAFFSVLTRTCSHPFSIGTLEIVHEKHCHYLCTVAAQGHASLVRPLRLGQRRGAIILVNRQLQIANAFEDLLHERWPRFGRFARAAYDRVGLPVSRWIRSPLAADAVYLAMKPAEWLFYLALLLLDPTPPEARIERMYR